MGRRSRARTKATTRRPNSHPAPATPLALGQVPLCFAQPVLPAILQLASVELAPVELAPVEPEPAQPEPAQPEPAQLEPAPVVAPVQSEAPPIVPVASAAPASGPAPILGTAVDWRRHVSHRVRLLATFAAVAMLALIVRDRGEVMRAISHLSFLKPGMLSAGAGGVFLKGKAPIQPIAAAAKPAPPACPSEMALVVRDEVRVCVDRWEGSLVEVLPDGDEVPWSPYLAVDDLPAAGRAVKAVSRAGVIPQGYIDRESASLACRKAGKRLCQAAEWTAACEGPRKTTYPYGNEADEKACNTHGKSPLGELFSASFKDHLYDSKVMNDPSLNALDGTVAPTGEFAQCTNGFGVYDMVGNLHEWTAEKNGVFHGGYYQDATQNGSGCHYATSAHLATYHDYSTGFRCCKDALDE